MMLDYEPTERTLRTFGLTREQWHAMFDAQLGRCAICSKLFSRARLPCIDHDHHTGLNRGLICGGCNDELGYRHDNTEWFANAARYLQNPPALGTIGATYFPGSPGAEGAL